MEGVVERQQMQCVVVGRGPEAAGAMYNDIGTPGRGAWAARPHRQVQVLLH